MPRVCLISDCLVEPHDEGARGLAAGIAMGLRSCADVLTINTSRRGPPAAGTTWIPASRPLFSPELWTEVRRFRPELILYLPWSSASPLGVFSSHVLRRALPSARVAMVAFQPRSCGHATRLALRWLWPHQVLCFSHRTKQHFEQMKVRASVIPTGVDGARFRPADEERRRSLRAKYELPQSRRIVLHVGHLKRERNVQVMADLAGLDGWTAVLVVSTSTLAEADLVRDLSAAGVVVIREALPDIQELYQLADCYVFPVEHELACAEVPLSVLEALACGLPVVSTRFGGLPDLLDDVPGVSFVAGADETVDAVRRGPLQSPSLEIAARLSWPHVAATILRKCRPPKALCPSRFICITGMDGGGKTTQARWLDKRLRGEGIRAKYVWCRGRPLVTLPLLMIGRKALGAPSLLRTPRAAKSETEDLAEAESAYQDTKRRLLHRGIAGWLWTKLSLCERLVEAWLKVGLALLTGRTVVADRYVYDSLVDLAAARGLADCSPLYGPKGLLAKLLPQPRPVFYIDVDENTAMARKDDIPSRDYLTRRRALYLGLSEKLEWDVLDGNQTPRQIAQAIWRQVAGDGE